jgi:hypothetical protein
MKVGDGYLIRSDPNDGFVEAWSAWHLPFEPRLPSQKEFRGHLRDALMRLGTSDALHAVFITSATVAGLDLENVLFYNVGTSVFRKVARQRLRFEKVPALPPVPPSLNRLRRKALHPISNRPGDERHQFGCSPGGSLASDLPRRPRAEEPCLPLARLQGGHGDRWPAGAVERPSV